MEARNENAPAGEPSGLGRGNARPNASSSHYRPDGAGTQARPRRLPPFAHQLRVALSQPAGWLGFMGTSADGTKPTLWVLAGSGAWDLSREWRDLRRLFVVLPPGDDPAGFNWSVLAGHDPVVLKVVGDLAGAEVQALVLALMRDGVQRVLFAGAGGLALYRTGASHAA